MKLLLINVLLCVMYECTNAEDILGCGGFIKSHINIDFSKVEIKLFTKQGSLREKTDCAPNGYYFLPLYDFGEYVLEIFPPLGWSFEPQSVSLNVDGKTDHCSLGKDINFVFKGFGITGQVKIIGQSKGPEGVKLQLIKEGNTETRETSSNEVGSFYFTPVFPGKYTVIAKHPRWSFANSEVTVVVSSGNTELPSGSLLINGFDVQGTVSVIDSLIDSVYIGVFHSNKKLSVESIKGCSKEHIPSFQKHDMNYLCYVKSETDGTFNIQSLPPGTYELVPHYYNSLNKVQYSFNPASQSITVAHSSLLLPASFEVSGITVSGRILTSLKGKGVENAEVIIDDVFKTYTNDQGIYTLKDFKPKVYEIKVNADNMKFYSRKIEVALKNPVLPDLVADEFQVCGQVVSNEVYSVAINKLGDANKLIVQTDSGNGNWCIYLPPGKYQVAVIVDDVQKSEGLQFFPLSQTIEVEESLVSGVVFSQLKAIVSGSINCLDGAPDSCKTQTITLKMLSNDGSYSKEDIKVKAENGKYKFDNVLPGTYKVFVESGSLWFDSLEHQIIVTKEKHEVPAFNHNGYSVVFDNSHKTKMTYSNKRYQETVTLNAGKTKIFVKDQGRYVMAFDGGCHTYGTSPEDLIFDTKDFPKVVKLRALSHANGISITSPIKAHDLYISINIDSSPEKKVHLTDANLELSSRNNYIYRYILQVEPDRYVQIEPHSEQLLFEPRKVEFVGGHDCKDQATDVIIARVGKVIEGRVQPPVDGVKITVQAPGLQIVTETDKNGYYKVGPIDGSINYKLLAEKDSFVFIETEGNFHAHRLCDITVSVTDTGKEKPLQGVLLSLSGGKEGYRKNILSNHEGTAIFGSLAPSEYYLKVVMKEYAFELASTKILVKEGESVKVDIRGTRTAFSAFGIITSLNGEPMANVEIEAVGQEDCSNLIEEVTTESNGLFRIRGLQPNCHYLVQVKNNSEFNNHIDHWTPRFIRIKVIDRDVEALKLIVFYPITHMDVTALITASNIEHYKSLKVKLFRENSVDSPLHSEKLENPNFRKGFNPGLRVMFPRIPADGKNYYIQLETNLSPSQFKYNIQFVQFSATGSFKHVQLDFNATTKAPEQDLNKTSMLALPIIILISLIFFNQQKVFDMSLKLVNKLNSVPLKSNTNQYAMSHQTNVVDQREIEQIVQNINSVKKKPKPKKI